VAGLAEEEEARRSGWLQSPARREGRPRRDDMGLLSHRVERSEIKPGDHIYTWRAGYTYSHHGTHARFLLRLLHYIAGG